MPKSATTLIIENLSSKTRSSDIKKEMSRYGPVLEVERDVKDRCALVLFKRSDDAKYAWKKAEGTKFDGRSWRVEWATDKDYKFFDWKWPDFNDRSPSRSPSPSPPHDMKTASTQDRAASMGY